MLKKHDIRISKPEKVQHLLLLLLFTLAEAEV